MSALFQENGPTGLFDVMAGNVISLQTYHSPCGELILGSCGDKLCLCDWGLEWHRAGAERRLWNVERRYWNIVCEERSSAVLMLAAQQLDEYFAGARKGFSLPLLLCGSEFQQSVWRELQKIPYGSTITYGELASQLGRASAVRAVANANAANVLSLFVPCHRVIGRHHALTGYRGGLEAKRHLLQLESNLLI